MDEKNENNNKKEEMPAVYHIRNPKISEKGEPVSFKVVSSGTNIDIFPEW